MVTRKGVSAIIFFDGPKEIEYLLLKRKLNWGGWEFLKGGRKKGENELDCLKREMGEEIGIRRFGAQKTKEIHRFDYKKDYIKDNREWSGARNSIYLVQIFTKKIKIDRNEHLGFRWVDRKSVLRMLTWKDYNKIFKELSK